MTNTLYVGNRNYSSWSLRPWLVLRWAKIAFEDVEISLSQPGYGKQGIAEVLRRSPSGRVPALHAGSLVIWDSLAIAEWAAEEKPEARLWPVDRATRAMARAVVAEMHSGFSNIRNDLSMNIHRRCKADRLRDGTRAEIARVDQLWTELRRQRAGEGPWLFGARTIADAFYAPVATRFRTYGIAVSNEAQAWCDAVFADPDFRDWEALSKAESWDRPGFPVIDGLYR